VRYTNKLQRDNIEDETRKNWLMYLKTCTVECTFVIDCIHIVCLW